MKPDISKYFWGLNEKSLKETKNILKNPGHRRFAERLTTILSRCDRPKELFSMVSREDFIEAWPRVRRYWKKVSGSPDFRDWWQTIYEQILQQDKAKRAGPKGKSPALFLKIGEMIRLARIHKGLSQNELALSTRIRQPDISMIEAGKKNITLGTLISLCRVLGIKKIDLS